VKSEPPAGRAGAILSMLRSPSTEPQLFELVTLSPYFAAVVACGTESRSDASLETSNAAAPPDGRMQAGISRWCNTAGNNLSGGALSFGHRMAGSPARRVADQDPASERFGDQLVAVLPRLRRFARGLTGSSVEADDLVQAACERALARRHQFQEGTRFDSWMFRIVQTIWIDQIRSREVRKSDGDIGEDRLGSDEPVRRVEARLTLAEVRRAVDRLTPDQRAALLLVTVDGLSYKEAAEVVDVPVGTIMSRLARARIALQLQLEAAGGMRRSRKDAEAQ